MQLNQQTELQYSLPIMLITFSVDLGMENILYIKQESRTKQQILGVHIVGLRGREGGDGEKTWLFICTATAVTNRQFKLAF